MPAAAAGAAGGFAAGVPGAAGAVGAVGDGAGSFGAAASDCLGALAEVGAKVGLKAGRYNSSRGHEPEGKELRKRNVVPEINPAINSNGRSQMPDAPRFR